jgi:hypothetical protein
MTTAASSETNYYVQKDHLLHKAHRKNNYS